MPEPKTALILLAMGGPDSVQGVRRYLYNIFSDRSIIRLPGGPFGQKPLAKLISTLRTKKVQAHYELIGGRSPLVKWTQAQLDHVLNSLSAKGADCSGYIGMRYYDPYTERAIEQAYRNGCRRIVFLPMYPQYCKATTGSSFEIARKVTAKYADLEAVYIDDFHDDADYIALLRSYIVDNITDDETLLFSAHSIPQKFVDEGDPYVDQTKKTVALVANDRENYLSFQSRSGPVTWVGPDTIDETKRLLSEGRKLFVVPISFVCDHIETLYEIDIELPQVVGLKEDQSIRRMPMINDDPRFGKLLAKIVEKRLSQYAD